MRRGKPVDSRKLEEDKSFRLTITADLRKVLDIEDGDFVDIFVDDKQKEVILKKRRFPRPKE